MNHKEEAKLLHKAIKSYNYWIGDNVCDLMSEIKKELNPT